MATKSGTVYSTNPKMDTSGIRGSRPIFGMSGKVGSSPVTGGKLYMEAIEAQAERHGMKKTEALTTRANLKAAAKLVSQGYPCDYAMSIVSENATHHTDD